MVTTLEGCVEVYHHHCNYVGWTHESSDIEGGSKFLQGRQGALSIWHVHIGTAALMVCSQTLY